MYENRFYINVMSVKKLDKEKRQDFLMYFVHVPSCV